MKPSGGAMPTKIRKRFMEASPWLPNRPGP
jgi:hypothetical protein